MNIKYAFLIYPVFWLFSLVPVWGVVVLIFSLKTFILTYRTKLMFLLLIFGILQLLSIAASIGSDYFQLERFLPIIHNFVVYLLIVLGLGTVQLDKGIENSFLKKSIIGIFFFVSLIFYLHLYFGPIVIHFPWGDLAFSRYGYLLGQSYPRVSFLVPYVNASGVLALILYIIVSFQYVKKTISVKEVVIYGLLCLVVAGAAGSRTGVILIFTLLFLNAIFSLGSIMYVLGLAVLIFVSFLIFSFGALEFVSDMRKNSSEDRLGLYLFSLNMMWENSVFWGLGQKPIVDDFAIPIGSHSTYIGYVVKNGVFGIAFVSLIFSYLLVKIFLSILRFNASNFHTVLIFSFLILSGVTEDIDSFELNALLFGMALGEYFKIIKER